MKSSERELYEKAHLAGMRAGNGETVTPMVVGTPSTPFGSDSDNYKKTY